MKYRLCALDHDRPVDKLPHHTDDKSGIGAHYVDAFSSR